MANRGRRSSRLLSAALLVLLVIVLSGCGIVGDRPQSWNVTHADNARKIWSLFDLTWWLSVVVFVIVQGLLIYALIRFRRRPGQPMPSAIHGNTKLEIGWTIMPALILAVIAVPTLTTIADLARDPGPDALTVEVVGHQWWWEFKYPDSGVVTADELHIPANRPIRLVLHSADVIHSFWVPQLAGKQDVVPGHTNHIYFTADTPGKYFGQCAEFCGEQHAHMAFRVIVDPPDQFQAWVAQNQKPATIPTGDLAKGWDVFKAKGCGGCHTINGTDAKGTFGPNLTHFGSRGEIAGAVLPNTPENLRAWIHNPQAVKPGTKMPNLGLNDQELSAVVAFLESLK
ncbi:MAG: cytochrome c oxidase subunit II [Thermomicrobiaceae bacterium]|nr:cytochrome c oxidase subunit II [Thermomicrobiaceae bacterium]